MKDELINTDLDDINDLLPKIETSFRIKFDKSDKIHVKTFGELCDVIINKIEGNHVNDCTTQQAFYKIRKAIINTLQCDRDAVKPGSQLANMFPRVNRRKQVQQLETALGCKIHILEAKAWLSNSLLVTALASLIVIFFSPLNGLLVLGLSIAGRWLSSKQGKELKVHTVEQLVKKLTREHYMDLRRAPGTVNRTELITQIKELFKADLYLDDNALRADAPLY